MGKTRPFVRELGQRRSARLEALEISKAAAAEEAAARAAKEAQTPREPLTEPVRRRGRKKQKCRTVEEVVVNSVVTGFQQAGNNDNSNAHLLVLGSQSNPPFHSPPDKRVLEFIIDMLQKNDKERIFSEPVNPAEVEHYYEIIKHPMDLSTMRAKLHEGKYETLEQFERDIFLLTENVLMFNDNNTIYYQEACDMRDLAGKIFRSLRSSPGGNKLDEIFKLKSKSKPVGSGVKIHNEGGSTRFRESAILALPSDGHERLLSGNDGLNKKTYPGFLSIGSNPFADSTRTPENPSGSRGGRKSLVAEERENACRPYAAFLSKDEASASTVYNNKPATIVSINGVNYRESLRNFAKDLGPKAQEIAERKIKECELREQQLRNQIELAKRVREQRQTEERQLRGKGPLTPQTATVPNVPQRSSAAPPRPVIENPPRHQSVHDQTFYSNMQSRGQVNTVYDCGRLGMSNNWISPNSPSNTDFGPGEFTAALTDGLVTRIGEGCIVMASTRVPPRDPEPSFQVQENNPASTSRISITDAGPSFMVPNSITPAPGCSQSRLWQAKDPSSSMVLNPMHGLQGETVIDPTEVGFCFSDNSILKQSGSIFLRNQAGSLGTQQLDFDAGALARAAQVQEAHLLGMSHLQYENSQVGGLDYQLLQQSSSSANQPWEIQAPGMEYSTFGGEHPMMAQFQGTTPMGPFPSPSPAPAWMVKSFTGAEGDHQFMSQGPQGGLPSIDLNQLQGQHFSQTEPTSHDWVHSMAPSSSGGDEQILLNHAMGSSAVAKVDLFTHLHNRQSGSSSATPGHLLTQLQEQKQHMGSGAAGTVDLVNHQTTAGIFDLSLVESCLRSAASRKAADAHREPSDPREGGETTTLMRVPGAAFGAGASTGQQPEPTEREFLNFLDKSQPDLALQL
ncbi:hypothetical protein H6P81_014674 [Aristolochia fimbriata]|uniref:Bromo domain-containing protein n=1 Tax=Aristolochia fimbriata TaxID=158543 RepID=A0AAV7E555_ARIFI|nr:hypothetical protein H6P81_014674 [Aristolochia fimbriata]